MLQFKQSPVNIKTANIKKNDHEVKFHYVEEQFHVFDSGLNISLMPTDAKSYILKNDRYFHLSEVHFHRPSEHQINDHQFDMEVHLVHQESHETLVYSILLNISENGFKFGEPFSNLSNNILIDLSRLSPRTCWDYHGSFTTSPFDEVVIWLINQDILSIDSEQASLINKYYPNNNRCLQPINNRDIHCIHATTL